MEVVEAVRHVESSRMVSGVNDGYFSRDILLKYKRRKVSATRDFPPGCGHFTPQINNCMSHSSGKIHSSTPSSGLGRIDRVTSDQVDRLKSVAGEHVSLLPEALEGSDGLASVRLEPVSQLPKALECLDDTILGEPSKVSKLEAAGPSEDLTKDCPPRRSVSAIRDFPPFCGRKTHFCHAEDNVEVFSSSETKSLCQQMMDVGNKFIEETNKTHRKDMGEDIQGGVAPENDLEENGIKLTGEESQMEWYKAEAMRKLDEFTTLYKMEEAQSNEIVVSMKRPCESNQYSRDETDVEKGKIDVEILEKNLEKEIYDKSCLKRKLAEISGSPEQLQEGDCEGLKIASRRMIIQALRAPPNSIGKQEKMSSELNLACITSEIKGKKHGHLENSKYAARRMKDKFKDSWVKSMTMSTHARKAEGKNAEAMRKQHEFATSSNTNVSHRNVREKSFELSCESNQYSRDETMVEKGNIDARYVGKEITIYSEKRSHRDELSHISGSKERLQDEDCELWGDASGRIVVQGLLAGAKSMGRQGKISCKLNPVGSVTRENKGKNHVLGNLENYEHAVRRKKDEFKDLGGKSVRMNSPPIGNAPHHSTSQLIVLDGDCSEDGKEIDHFHENAQPHQFDLRLPPFSCSDSSSKGGECDGVVTRNQVRETLRLFQAVCRKLLQEEEMKSKEQRTNRRRVDLPASKILKNKGKYVNTGKHILGSVPGVEVGDEFYYRVELNIIGLHRHIQGGIDYVKHGEEVLATSIVASGGYDDVMDNSDFLIYTGQGGNLMSGDKEPEDQKLERGNLALKNSILAKNPVRVIRGFQDRKASDSSDARAKPVLRMTYIYDGLYLVEKSWQEEGSHGKLIFKFRLVRIPGQPELAWKQVKKSVKSKVREGLCDNDISRGKEVIPICAVNTLDDQKPPSFEYITSMLYPDWCRPVPPHGCECTKKCSESKNCSCAIMNGGEIPYNYDGAIVVAKPLVYECGPSCKCPPSCPNRVSQRGIKFQLEIFKTKSRGWGVRSLNSISSGSFICEYVGELIEEKEADERTGNDEYLFDIGNNYNDTNLWGGLSSLMPDTHSSAKVVEDGCFTIDAARYGNIGRFINHSCSPNLYAQNVLYDHGDKRVPHIMLFAAENIPPLQELTYHYNYTIDQVRDSDGNIKKKSCYCGAADCTGRMY